MIKGVLKSIWAIIVLILHKYYPPRLFIFYPLYKRLRHRMKLPFLLSIFGVWFISAVLHSGLLLLFGLPVAAVFFFFIFCGLGLMCTVAAWIKKLYRKPQIVLN